MGSNAGGGSAGPSAGRSARRRRSSLRGTGCACGRSAATDCARETSAEGAAPGRARSPRCRRRPPRRPRRRRCFLGSAPAATPPAKGANGCARNSSGASTDNCSGSAAGPASMTSPAAGACSEGAAGAETPRRARASAAFVFHCARRNRCAAVEYQRAASASCPDRSWNWASSNATIASRVFSKRALSWPGGSAPALALRMRAWICRQSAMAEHCSSP